MAYEEIPGTNLTGGAIQHNRTSGQTPKAEMAGRSASARQQRQTATEEATQAAPIGGSGGQSNGSGSSGSGNPGVPEEVGTVDSSDLSSNLNSNLTSNVQGDTIKLKNSELKNGLPISMNKLPEGKRSFIVDKVDDDGRVLQRRIYGKDGRAAIDFDTSDHEKPRAHPTGAHKHVFDYSKKRPRSSWRPLTDEELKDNSDIIQRGVNYHDENRTGRID